MTPQPEHHPAGSPHDWLTHAESDLNLARLAKDQAGILYIDEAMHIAEEVFTWATAVVGGSS